MAKKALLQIIKLGKDRQERIEKGAELLSKFAKAVLKKVPNALRKAKKHNDKNTQKKIEAVQDKIRREADLLARVIAQTAARYAGTHVKKKVYSYHEPQVTCIAKASGASQMSTVARSV